MHYGRVVRKDCCVVFSASDIYILCSRQCKGKVATNYLQELKTIKIFQYKNLVLLKPPQTIRSGIQHCNHWEKRNILKILEIIFDLMYQEFFQICKWWRYKGARTYILIGILNVLFLERTLCAVLVSQEIEVYNLIQSFLLFFRMVSFLINFNIYY